jgi:hypothetical protein
MGAGPSMLDESWGYANPAAAKAAGVQAVMMYLSPDPSKNATPAKVRGYHDVGIGVVLGWESTADRALQGAGAGTADANESIRQAQALFDGVGYAPKNRVEIYFAIDFDTNSSQYPAIDAYLNAAGRVLHPAGFGVADYGEYNLVEHTANRAVTDAEWQTYAWSGGQLSTAADLYQYLNGQNLGGASVDFDQIMHAAQAGVWWPPNNPLNQGEDVPFTDDDAQTLWHHALTKGDTTATAAVWLENANTNSAAAVQAAQDAVAAVNALRSSIGAANDSPDIAKLAAAVAAMQKQLTSLTSAVKTIQTGTTANAAEIASQLEIQAKQP